MAEKSNEEEKELFFHPETGEQISKNAFKKLQKGAPVKKEKKEKPVASAANVQKKAEKKAKEPEVIFEDNTPVGEKKIIEGEFPPTYQPKYVESAWQSWWEKSGFYAADRALASEKSPEDKFILVIPPPNVTGSLHLGHALTNAIEDTIVRWNRMKGKITLWIPGTDHAGIATQSVVEKKLKKDEGVSRHDLGREEFVRRVWEWKESYGSKITNQIRCLGASVDWSREAFTMDANLSRAVTEAFVRFHEDGLLYRDTRLINWSCALQSAISEIEVDYIDLEGRTFLSVPNHKLKDKYEFGMITSFAYKVDGSETEELVVATTRLETMLGDAAVAVHPADPRYTHLHGKYLVHPFIDRKIPIITDAELVDMEFGTGAVKVTPAHDPNDYTCGKRNNLEFHIVLNENGTINNHGGNKYAGMMRYDCRVQMEADLAALGLLRGKEPNKMRLGLCSRSGDIIEPMLTPQWYVNCNSMAARAVEAVRKGELQIIPEMHENTWFRWLENIRDWCVSRQLWWGHRIPAYFAHINGEERVDRNDPAHSNRWIVARSIDEARAMAASKLGVAESNLTLEQDEDVLDTWFSSGLFPFSVFGWPNQTADFEAFYPTSLLETGTDILFFWVARMVMMGLHLTDKLPFTKVYLHSMVRDKYGRKMSKSVGNVIDPLEVINGCTLEDLLSKIYQGNLPEKEVIKAVEGQSADFPQGIPECGADALRFGLLAYTSQARDINLDIKRVVGYRQFCNKLWNAARFGLTYLTDFVPTSTMHLDILSSPAISTRDLFILSRLNATIEECNQQLTDYNFGAVASCLHSFFLYDVCDLYLELLKPVISDTSEANTETRKCAQATLFTVLEQYLRLTHPLMPFVTEELWQRLPQRESFSSVPSIMIAAYPEAHAEWYNSEAEELMNHVKEAIHGARSLRADYRIPNHVKADFYFRSNSPKVSRALTELQQDFCTLAKGNSIVLLNAQDETPKGCCVKILSENCSLLVNLLGVIDIEVEIARLSKETARLQPQIDTYTKKVASASGDADSKIPETVRIANAEKLAALQVELDTTIAAIAAFELLR